MWNDCLGPRNTWRFKMRIALRVQRLFFKRWWNENVSLRGLLSGMRRPTVLLLIGLGLPLLMLWLLPFDALVKPVAKDGAVQLTDQLAWKELIQPILLFIGLPSAFILWAFRDYNASAALENQRKDINLKEFQEIQLRAAGALDEKLPAKARETLQVAAIHQLRPFLRGEYGSSFRRPAWELLKALLATSAEESGYTAIREWVIRGGFPEIEGESAEERAERNVAEIKVKIRAVRPDAIAIAAQTLITEDAQHLFRRDLPLENGRYDGVNLSGALLAKADLTDSSFVQTRFNGAHLESARLCWAHLEGATLTNAHLENANLEGTHLEGAFLLGVHLEEAFLFGTHLEGAVLRGAHMECASIYGANLEWADLESANLEGTYCYAVSFEGAILSGVNLNDETVLEDALFDDHTRFADDWDTLTEAEREAARQPWRDRGMIHVDEVERDE